ncbi:hypothetical protein LTR56_023715 [Elasticomyces elasticus]|nr:hypothetical protein LTR56_023715 [Elasticomyces elasticus]KAK3624744.1 hypothetical protein LTR22_023855 [Elasticomyces elasticus]KAK4906748.1 hypothetical protein LTR49_024161 [Elasticomyces elasticus]KAK5765249.1 hypothetical protein LTS12_004506 [Elasticomyces elasticus]
MPRRRTKRAADITQHSPLLRLAPELRNLIYEYCLPLDKVESYGDSGILLTPALGRVCQQLRKEYGSVYKSYTLSGASKVEIHVKNFQYDNIIPTLRSLPRFNARTSDGAEIEPYTRIRICVHLTNEFTQYRNRIRGLNDGLDTGFKNANGGIIYLRCEYRFVFDDRTFDKEYANEVMRKMDWCLGRPVFRSPDFKGRARVARAGRTKHVVNAALELKAEAHWKPTAEGEFWLTGLLSENM